MDKLRIYYENKLLGYLKPGLNCRAYLPKFDSIIVPPYTNAIFGKMDTSLLTQAVYPESLASYLEPRRIIKIYINETDQPKWFSVDYPIENTSFIYVNKLKQINDKETDKIIEGFGYNSDTINNKLIIIILIVFLFVMYNR